ncbi:MAG: hypothetical protein DRJ05_12720 [Bacteroidetes bacterium]|nr:MAG: hypothetical protein DRJ05_12720 [Bacteroidota bacterium]
MKRSIKIIFLFIITIQGYSQSLDFASLFLRGGIEDGGKLLNAYVEPLHNTFSAAGNSNWNFPSQSEDSKIHFYFEIKYSYTTVPTSDREYDIYNLGLQELKPSDPSQHIAQTVFGDASAIQLETNDHIVNPWPPFNSKPLATFNSPEGTGIHGMQLPWLHLGINYKGTQVSLRALPPLPIQNGDGNIGLWGIGAGQNINKLIKGLHDFPVEFKLIAAYSRTNLTVKQNLQPDEAFISLSGGPYDNQNFELKTKGYNLDFYVMKKLGLFIFSGGPGYAYSQSDVELTGTYPIYVKDPAGIFGFSIADINDPIDQTLTDGFFKAGLNVAAKFNFLLINIDMQFGKYNTFAGGIGFIL